MTCIDGKAGINTCPADLVFDENAGVCTWPANAGRIHVTREEETQRQLIRKEAQVRAQSDIKGNDLNWDEGTKYKTIAHFNIFCGALLSESFAIFFLSFR